MDTSDRSPRSNEATEQKALIDVLVQASFMTMAVLNTVAAGDDLSLTQLRVLAILRDRRVRMSALAAYLGLDRSTMSGLVERAEKRGLLIRTPDTRDGRAVEVSLTQRGAELADGAYIQIDQMFSASIARLAPTGQRRLQNLLKQMIVPE